jgi:Zinc dependent phospholipase C
MIIAAVCSLIAIVVLIPTPALAWGPITHIALGVQVLATVITPEHPLEAILLSMPEVFLYGSLAPDIVQGRRLQSRLRRHSHNWSTGLALLKSARGAEQQVFAYGYLAHLGADVVAHNFFLPARFVGRFDKGIPSHILAEARFDSLQQTTYRDLLLKVIDIDFSSLDRMLKRAIDSPLFSFKTHQRLFEGGLRRIREFDRVMRAIGRTSHSDAADIGLFSDASCCAVEGVLHDPAGAPAHRFDPMGAEAIATALTLRRNLQRLTRLSPAARASAREMADAMLSEVRQHLKESPFISPPAASS